MKKFRRGFVKIAGTRVSRVNISTQRITWRTKSGGGVKESREEKIKQAEATLVFSPKDRKGQFLTRSANCHSRRRKVSTSECLFICHEVRARIGKVKISGRKMGMREVLSLLLFRFYQTLFFVNEKYFDKYNVTARQLVRRSVKMEMARGTNGALEIENSEVRMTGGKWRMVFNSLIRSLIRSRESGMVLKRFPDGSKFPKPF